MSIKPFVVYYICTEHDERTKMKPVKRTSKIDNADLFTTAASEHYQKHIKTQSKQTLSFINDKIDWQKLLQPIGCVLSQHKAGLSSSGRHTDLHL